MKKVGELPRIKDLTRLSREIDNFAITALGIIQYAEHQGYSDEIIKFLKLCPATRVFKSRSDFIGYCSLLESLLREEEISTPERPKSPQD